jgi:tight adherence protein C
MPSEAAIALSAVGGAAAATTTAALLWPRAQRAAAIFGPEQPRRAGLAISLPRVPALAAGGLVRALRGAGWNERPERFVAGVALASAGAGFALGLAAWILADPALAPGLAIAGFALPPIVALRALSRAARERRRRLEHELAALLELVGVELAAGTPALSAFDAVLDRCGGELARLLRSQLIGSRIAGSAPFDARVARLGEELDVPALATLGLALALSREYGAATGPALRALAADLHADRRRNVIAVSRRALNRVLIPVAVGVLLPFMAVLLFPAVVTLAGNLR